jgi:hypothetical protein
MANDPEYMDPYGAQNHPLPPTKQRKPTKWQSYKTMPRSQRVLVCYMNLWGYNHVTEAYWDDGEDWPVTASGASLKGTPFVWRKMPEGPSPSDWIQILEMKRI